MFIAHRALIATLRAGSNFPARNLPRFAQHSPRIQPFSTALSLQQQVRYQRFKNASSPKRYTLAGRIMIGVGALGGVFYITHLERVKETGRLRFMVTSPETESQMAEIARRQQLEEYKGKILPPHHPITRHIRDVVNRILQANDLGTLRTPYSTKVLGQPHNDVWDADGAYSGRTQSVNPEAGGNQWELLVVDDDSVVNAAASFGNIIVFTGILPVSRTEDGLAAVLSHEIGHVVARHNAEKVSSMSLASSVAFFASLLLGLDLNVSSLIFTLLMSLPNSRQMELEADEIGLKLMSKACYNPREAPEMFKRLGRLEEQKGGMNIGFLSTHPLSATRVVTLEKKLPDAYAIRAATAECAGVVDSLESFQNASGWTGRHV